jgi:hypothetical protein
VGRVSEAEAEAKADQLDYLPMRIVQGRIVLSLGADIVAFLRHDGVIPAAGDAPVARGELTLAGLRDRYLETHGAWLEHHTMRGILRHFRHLCRVPGEGFPSRSVVADVPSSEPPGHA